MGLQAKVGTVTVLPDLTVLLIRVETEEVLVVVMDCLQVPTVFPIEAETVEHLTEMKDLPLLPTVLQVKTGLVEALLHCMALLLLRVETGSQRLLTTLLARIVLEEDLPLHMELPVKTLMEATSPQTPMELLLNLAMGDSLPLPMEALLALEVKNPHLFMEHQVKVVSVVSRRLHT